METKLPTAEEFLIHKGVANPIGEIWRLDLSRDCYAQTEKDIHTAMIEFAKLHCEAQAKAIIENVEINDYDEHFQYSPHVDKNSILKSYPLENIK
jgi:hypothetical protein